MLPGHPPWGGQASAALASFVGIDGLVVKSTDLVVSINRGVQVAARAAEQIKINTQLQLALGADAGTLRFNKGTDHADVALTPGSTIAVAAKGTGANARLVIIEECGHMAPLEKPAEVSAALRRWLTQ